MPLWFELSKLSYTVDSFISYCFELEFSCGACAAFGNIFVSMSNDRG